MKRILQAFALILFVAGCSTTGNLLTEADKHYDNLEYHEAAKKYTLYLKTKKDNKADIRLAECYSRMNHYNESEQAYAKVIGYPEITNKQKLDYAHVLKHNGKYKEAARYYVEYLLENPNDGSVTNELRSCDSVTNYNRYAFQYVISEPGFGSTASDFSPIFYKNGLVFTSERTASSDPSKLNKWTGHPYLDLYFTEMKAEEMASKDVKTGGPRASEGTKKQYRFSEPVLFASEINSPYNEGPACFSKDNNTMYFTRNATGKKNKPQENKEHINNFEIYKSVNNAGVWSKPEMLSFDNKDYSVGHPALGKSETRLYFVSDKPGGFGGSDIYYADFTNGKWTEPINAGGMINTNQNEMFPTVFVDEKGNEFLYFSTSGLPGLGGLDIYSSAVVSGMLSKPTHLNAPLNSSGDDFGMILFADGLSGFLSTNRDANDGHDRIIAFKKQIPEFFVDVVVYKKGTKEPIEGARVDISDVTHGKKDFANTDSKGRIFRKIDQDSKLMVNVKRDNFFSASGVINNISKIQSDTLRLTLELEPIVVGKAIKLDNIYYDYNKADIRADAKPSLDVLVKLMKENTGIQIELSSHTDSRGGDAFNLKLSQKRAQSAVDYIISQGLSSERIYAKGYGETKPLNKCVNKVKCTDDEYQVNRRTEFKVVKIINELPPTNLNP